MDFRCQRSTFNLEKANAYVKEIFLFTTQLDLLTPESFFKSCISQGYIQHFERNWKSSIYVRVNNLAKFVIFLISRETSQRKKLKLSKLEYYSLWGKDNFSVIHPTHITIYSF